MSPTILLLVLAVLPPPRTPEALVERALRAAGMKRPDQPVAIYCHYQLRSKDGPAGSLQIWINATADTWLVVRRPEKEESIGNPVETVCYGVLHENRRLSLILRAEDAKRRTEAFFRPFGRQEALIWLAPLLIPSSRWTWWRRSEAGKPSYALLSPRWPLLHLRFDSACRLLQSTATGPTTHTTLTLRDHPRIGVRSIDAERPRTRAGIAFWTTTPCCSFLTERAPGACQDDIRQAIDDLGGVAGPARKREARLHLRSGDSPSRRCCRRAKRNGPRIGAADRDLAARVRRGKTDGPLRGAGGSPRGQTSAFLPRPLPGFEWKPTKQRRGGVDHLALEGIASIPG
ncbi:MAG: hypothetical protein U0793_24620 [Gemmataceae bacterium]